LDATQNVNLELFAIIEHIDNTKYGHYIAVIKNESNQLILFNDSNRRLETQD
jgi:ubiquitin C-terminal hydrolase